MVDIGKPLRCGKYPSRSCPLNPMDDHRERRTYKRLADRVGSYDHRSALYHCPLCRSFVRETKGRWHRLRPLGQWRHRGKVNTPIEYRQPSTRTEEEPTP